MSDCKVMIRQANNGTIITHTNKDYATISVGHSNNRSRNLTRRLHSILKFNILGLANFP